MKAITVKQPWASLIVHGIKDIENRTWKTNFRGRVLIHASACKKTDHIVTPEVFDWSRKNYQIWAFGCQDSPKSAIIGSVEIVDCVLNHSSIWAEKSDERLDSAKCRIEKPIYNWVVANPILFPEPIPAKGKLSFWEFEDITSHEDDLSAENICQCSLPVKEENQVMNMIDHFRCRYCGGIWYK